MNQLRRFAVLSLVVAAVSSAATAPAFARKQERRPDPKGYPTIERVSYVLACMRDHPGPQHEMVSKCSCAIDEIAAVLSFDDYAGMSTAANAITIGGERGSTMRDSEQVQGMVKRYREIQTKAKKSCFLIQ